MSALAPGPPGGCHISPQEAQKSPENGAGLMESSQTSVCRCCINASQRTWPTGADPVELKPLKDSLLRQSGVSGAQLCSCSGQVGLETQPSHPWRAEDTSATTQGWANNHIPPTPTAEQSLQTHPGWVRTFCLASWDRQHTPSKAGKGSLGQVLDSGQLGSFTGSWCPDPH